MQKIICWTVPSDKKSVAMVNDGIAAFFRTKGLPRNDSLRLQGCVEGVFSYLVGNILEQWNRKDITIQFFWDVPNIKVVMQHDGPGGQWDNDLREDVETDIRRTSFDSMGLFIAHDILSSLTYESKFDLVSGRTMKTYELVYTVASMDQAGCVPPL